MPNPYKRYAIGPVWRADRPGRGRFREFTQCDVDVVGSVSPLVEAEVVCAGADALDAMGVTGYTILVNSRQALNGLMEVYGVPAELAGVTLITLDKLDKLTPAQVVAELTEGRGLAEATARSLVEDLTAEVYLGGSRKLAKQLKWASDRGARFALLSGPSERADGVVTVRDMSSGEQERVTVGDVFTHLANRCAM